MFSGFELYPRWVPLIYAPRNYWYEPKSTVSGRVRGTLRAEPPLRSSGLANLVFCTWSNWFFRVKHLFIDKTMARVLVLSKDLTQCM